MSIKVDYKGDTIAVKINEPRIEGKNNIFQTLVEDHDYPQDIDNLVFDLDAVNYVNSLGIAEFISIHRYFSSINEGKTKISFVNVDKKIATLFEMVELGNLSTIVPKK